MNDPSLHWVVAVSGYHMAADVPDNLLPEPKKPKEASVLIPLYRDAEEWHVLFIRRVVNERDQHSGQVAFPGGRRDPIDTDATSVALREAHEEIGLNAKDVNVVHVLPEYRTGSDYVVTPVVGIVPWPYSYQAQPDEVSRIFSIPLKWLATQANSTVREKTFTKGDLKVALKVVYYEKFDNELLWGASARMTVSLLKALYTGELILD